MTTVQTLRAYQNDTVIPNMAPPPALTPRETNLLHATLGLCAEVLELEQSTTAENTCEETGDVLWYLIFYATTIHLDLAELPTTARYDPHSNHLPLDDILQKTEELITATKKVLIYDKPGPRPLPIILLELWEAFLVYLDAINYPLLQAMSDNADKLAKRYEKGFTPEESLQQKDKQSAS